MEAVKNKTVNRAATVQKPAASLKGVQRKAVAAKSSTQLQSSLKVSSPKDPAEKEADVTAKKIMRMAVPESSVAEVRTGSEGVFRQVKKEEKEKKIQAKLESPYITRFANTGIFTQPKKKEDEKIQRKAEGQPNVASNVAADIQSSMAAGSPLPLSVRRFMEPRFQTDFSNVRIHTGEQSARLNRQVNAQAFTMGNQIFFGKDKFQPEQSEGKELIAHELTHTIQQGAAIQRSEDVTVTQQSPTQVQRLGLSDALDYFADKANLIPGFRMLTIILGVNPINMSRVERSAANILRALVEFLPGGGLITQALDNYGIFDRIGNWVEQQIRSLGMTGSVIRQAIDQFLDSLSWRDIFDLSGVWNRAKRIFTEPIDRIISFGRGIVTGIIQFIKDAILRPLARLAEGTRGYDLLKAVLGQDPITGDPVPRNADTLIGGFMKLIGQEEVWNNLKRANAVARAWAWFQGALSGLLGFVRQIPAMFLQALRSLEIADIVLLPRAFARVGSVFANFVGQFFSWAGQQVMSLLQIIFEVVAPGAMPYIRRAAGAFRSIIQNPIGFVGNLVRAGILGFRQFASNFLTHLRASLIGWLTGTMSGANIYIPQAFNLREILKFVLSVLGLTWQNIRQKLVRAIGETAVSALETGFELVKTLITEGPAAAWQQILEGISNLREMVMEQIMTFVRDRVVQAAITRLVTSLNPAGAFIQAIIATYNTIMFFVERLRQIAQVAMAFIDSIAAIASGVLTAAANRVEQTMAGLLTLVISFLARIAGLGRVSDAVTNIINQVRAPLDRALDRLVDWIRSRAQAIIRSVTTRVRGSQPVSATQTSSVPRGYEAVATSLRAHTAPLLAKGYNRAQLAPHLERIRSELRLTRLSLQGNVIRATVNPDLVEQIFEEHARDIGEALEPIMIEAEMRVFGRRYTEDFGNIAEQLRAVTLVLGQGYAVRTGLPRIDRIAIVRAVIGGRVQLPAVQSARDLPQQTWWQILRFRSASGGGLPPFVTYRRRGVMESIRTGGVITFGPEGSGGAGLVNPAGGSYPTSTPLPNLPSPGTQQRSDLDELVLVTEPARGFGLVSTTEIGMVLVEAGAVDEREFYFGSLNALRAKRAAVVADADFRDRQLIYATVNRNGGVTIDSRYNEARQARQSRFDSIAALGRALNRAQPTLITNRAVAGQALAKVREDFRAWLPLWLAGAYGRLSPNMQNREEILQEQLVESTAQFIERRSRMRDL